ncbi:NAD(P)-dependent oxidoreductase [Streptomyces sp. NRRL S-350]|uniref:NAD(P)-dependent oxidoreductase n=1 Tax=Streptomyces sp. NRRL S-350 TaxID=1463902 RepID=UPI0004C05690|nr:NAD(P)H-binding protein [Streptomyces sp. NRRL S-350]
MRIAVLGATGRVGRLVVEQALDRGHRVVALVRSPQQYDPPARGRVEVRRADVTRPQEFPELGDVDVLVSALGISKGDGPGTLLAGARLLAALPVRTLWLGALGSGASTGAGGRIYQSVMRMFVGKELAEKGAADTIVLAGGATVFHAPDLWVGEPRAARRNVPLAQYPKPLLPPHASRATVAALMLDEAELPTAGAGILVPTAGA